MAKAENSKQVSVTSKKKAVVKETVKKSTKKAATTKTTEDTKLQITSSKLPVKKAGPKASRAKLEKTRKASKKNDKSADKPAKKVRTFARPRIERRGKQYRKVAEQIEKGKEYSLEEATALAAKTNFAKFDASVELHVNLNVDPKQADQMVRGMVVLPHGNGKTQRVAVVTGAEGAKAAKAAGADLVGETDLLEEVKKGVINFDVLIATPDVMPKLGKYAKELGPKGLMPNPKSGTVTDDVTKAVKELKGGRVEFRIDGNGIVHQVIGKCSFNHEQLLENAQVLIKALRQAKPDGVKGVYIEKITLTTSMGPGIKVTTSSKV